MNQLKLGAILNYIIILLNTFVGLLYTPYMLRMMGQSEYGLYSLAASIISYLTILDLGFGNAVIRYTAKFRAENKFEEQYEMFGMFFILYLIIGTVTCFLGMGLYFNVDKIFGATMSIYELERVKIMMALLVFNLAFTFPMSIFASIITAYERFVFPRIVNIVRILLNTIVMVCLLKFGYKAIAMVIVQTIFNILTLLLNCVYCFRNLRIHIYFRKFKLPLLREVAIYSFWIFLNVIMDKVYWSTGQFVLGATVGAVAVAVFAVAIQLQNMYMQFSTAISSVFLPKVTGLVVANNDNQSISDLFIRTGRIQYIILSFVLSGFIVFGRPFISLWAGPAYNDAYIITLLFFISLLIPLIQNLGVTILQARNQMRFRSILYVIIAIVALIFQIIFAKIWGGLGCSIAVASALFIGQGVIMNIYYYRNQHIDIITFWKEIFKMSVIPAIIVCLGLLIFNRILIQSWSDLLLYICVFSIIYIPLFYRFSMNSYEREMLVNPIKRLVAKFKYDKDNR